MVPEKRQGGLYRTIFMRVYRLCSNMGKFGKIQENLGKNRWKIWQKTFCAPEGGGAKKKFRGGCSPIFSSERVIQ